MRIWLINHYGVPPKYYPLARPTLFAKNLRKMGHEVIIFASSAVHNSNINLITDRSLYRKETVDGVNYVYIRSRQYNGNGKNRMINLLEFAERLPKVCRYFKKPDAIVATSFDPISCYKGIRLAKKYNAKAIAEIADLWPETPIEYGMIKANNPVAKVLRILEKKIYMLADSIIFTMEGAYDYIQDQGWTKEIPRGKVFFINNGIDLEEFDFNVKEFRITDKDLDAPDTFKVVYTGSLRILNKASEILDVAKNIDDKRIQFLIWGDGDEAKIIRNRIAKEKIENVKLKSKVEKKYIPYILSKGDLCLLHMHSTGISKYGMSMNKSFDYLASGKPIVTTVEGKYDYIVKNDAGLFVESDNSDKYAEIITYIANLNAEEYMEFCNNARNTAEKYDFRVLTKRLEAIIRNSNDYISKTMPTSEHR